MHLHPYRIDWNDWYVLMASAVLMGLFLIIRKHFRIEEIVLLWAFNVTYVASIDYAVAATPFHLYYCGDNETYEPLSAVSHVFLYTPFSLFFLYFYDKWRPRGKRFALYLAAWTCFSVAFEWFNTKIGFLTYTGWKLLYSIPTYPLSALLLLQVWKFIQRNLPARKR